MSKTIFIVMMSLFLNVACATNWGHRAGADINGLPENSLLALEQSLKGDDTSAPLQEDDNFIYLEFDVQETYDGELVVFHDSKIKRMIPPIGPNQYPTDDLLNDENIKKRIGKKLLNYNDLEIKYLTLAEIKALRLVGDDFSQEIPTLQEFLEAAEDFDLRKPMIIEIKEIHSEKGKDKLLQLAYEFKINYMNQQDIIMLKKYDFKSSLEFLSFGKSFRKTFGWGSKKRKWCRKLKKHGFKGVPKPYTHFLNNCTLPW